MSLLFLGGVVFAVSLSSAQSSGCDLDALSHDIMHMQPMIINNVFFIDYCVSFLCSDIIVSLLYKSMVF